MKFIKTSSVDPVAIYLAHQIQTELEGGRRVLWLVCGGSAMAVALDVARQLADQSLDRLAVTLTDERYGEVGHADSNWQQLQAAGFTLPGAWLVPVLAGGSLAETTKRFGDLLERALNEAEFRVALFGVGPDGHVAGMLPGTPGIESKDWAVGYDAGAFQRLTMTGRAMAKLDEAVVYMQGKAKWPVVDQLERDIPPLQQPAQLLKQVPTVTIFNDHKGDAA